MAFETQIFLFVTMLFGAFHFMALLMSFAKWQKYPRVCLLLFIGSSLNLLGTLGRLVALWIVFLNDRGAYTVANLAISIVNLVGWVFYLSAVFADRESRIPRATQFDEEDWEEPGPQRSPDATDIRRR